MSIAYLVDPCRCPARHRCPEQAIFRVEVHLHGRVTAGVDDFSSNHLRNCGLREDRQDRSVHAWVETFDIAGGSIGTLLCFSWRWEQEYQSLHARRKSGCEGWSTHAPVHSVTHDASRALFSDRLPVDSGARCSLGSVMKWNGYCF